eukprot:TRINITY_DN4508_c0_g1_i2.p1 TRINITY_DN4508_c0_g1~~TRINITY_DN4508_c0_g1_i2.p1  ORF type:complete len:143 (-),score=16.95 TRINITY_DN4508_c0_g1_i2:190-618(-)
MRGYYKKPVETKQVLRQGWLHTGDLATMTEAQRIVIIDRKSDAIKCNGNWIYPREVEEQLYSHPMVTDAAVVGYFDLRQGEVPKAFVVTNNPKLTADEIIKFCSQRLPQQKVPKTVQILPALPRNASGKVMKRLLAASGANK